MILIKNVFQLQYLENRGAAFDHAEPAVLFVVIAAVILGIIGYLYSRMPYTSHYRMLRICAVLIASGSGNMIDRIRLNYVVDFFYFSLIDFPVFNVADCYVVIACIWFACLILFYYKDESDFDFLKASKRKKEINNMEQMSLISKKRGKNRQVSRRESGRSFPVLIFRNF